MLNKYELFHGSVLARLIHGSETELKIKQYKSDQDNASYIINDRVGLYIKYSTSRLSPWVFTFHREHQDAIEEMKDNFKDVFIALVCNDDGIACLSFDELKLILDYTHEPVEWIRVSRRIREKYKVSGKDGELKSKIGENEFPSKLLKVAKHSFLGG